MKRTSLVGATARIFGSSLVVIALLAILVPGAEAKKKGFPTELVTCGQEIDHSLRLANNLSCTGHGLVVAAPGITIDLGGHRISGDGDSADRGIVNTGGHDGVTVRNGTVTGFGTGVRVEQAAENSIKDLHVQGNLLGGIHLVQTSATRIVNVQVLNNNVGVRLESSPNNTFKGSTVSGNSSHGVLLVDSSDNTLKGNTSSGNKGAGMLLSTSSNRNTLKGNTAWGNGAVGLFLTTSSSNTLKGNLAWGNGSHGILLSTSASNSTVKANTSSGNDGDGIQIKLGSTGNVLKKNAALENGIHGISSDSNQLTLSANKAHGNGFLDGFVGGEGSGLGIDVPAGTTNSKNKAKGNDDPRQCMGADVNCHVSAAAPTAPAKNKAGLPTERVTCDQEIDHSLRVANNLNCTGFGLIVVAPDITIDLGGHRISGDGGGLDWGIVNTAGHNGVTVRNGLVAGFGDGVRLEEAEGNTLSDLKVQDNSNVGIFLGSSSNSNVLKGNTASGNGVYGIRLHSSSNNTLKGNTAWGNDVYGILLRSSSNNTLKGNVASANDLDGIYLYSDSDNNTLEGNVASGNADFGIYLFSARKNTLKGNAASANGRDGIGLGCSCSDDNTLKGNKASANDGHGISLSDDRRNVLMKNAAHGNGGHGIFSSNNDLTLVANRANGNGFLNGASAGDGLGIDVPLGTTNSKNKAKGNDDPNQCEAPDVNCHVPTP